jgi:SAM-dependent methyltransferase
MTTDTTVFAGPAPEGNRGMLWLKRMLYPGLDWHIRQRGRVVKSFLRRAEGTRTLDAGCGNGYFSFMACDAGHRVLAISNDAAAIGRAEAYRLFRGYSHTRIRFDVFNLYDLGNLNDEFDQILCLETLEHIGDDRRVVRLLHSRLVDGGELILGVPNSNAPLLHGEKLSSTEDGGHVRRGYTFEELDRLLTASGFRVKERSWYGRGGTRRAIATQGRIADLTASLRIHAKLLFAAIQAAAFLMAAPFVCFDWLSRSEPISVLVVAEKITAPLSNGRA